MATYPPYLLTPAPAGFGGDVWGAFGGGAVPPTFAAPTVVPPPGITGVIAYLLHMDDGNNSIAFIDSALPPPVWTPNPIFPAANAPVETTAQAKFGTGSGSFPATNTSANSMITNQILAGTPQDILSGTSDFTIDGWFMINNPNSGSNSIIFDCGDSLAAFNGMTLSVISTGPLTLNVNIQQNGTGTFWQGLSGSSGAITPLTWHHFAVVRFNGQGQLYLDGVQLGNTAANLWINYKFTVNPTCLFMLGWSPLINGGIASNFIDEFRVVKGQAIWTSNFTPPTAPSVNPTLQNTASPHIKHTLSYAIGNPANYEIPGGPTLLAGMSNAKLDGHTIDNSLPTGGANAG